MTETRQAITFWNCGECGAMITAKNASNADEMIEFHGQWHASIHRILNDHEDTQTRGPA